MDMLLPIGDIVCALGLSAVAIVFIIKLLAVVAEKEFKFFGFLIKLAVAIFLGGGLLLFIGRIL